MNRHGIPQKLIENRKLIWSLSKNDFKTRFAGSYLGIVWAFVQPVVTVLVYWFVFQVGLKAGRTNEYPFVVWLVAGLVPWFFFSEALNGGTNALIEYSYLVKKVVFKISILPIVKVMSAVFVNAFFILFTLVLCSCYGYTPSLYTIQIIYYLICNFLLVLGLSYFTAAIVVFFRDLTQIINILLQVGMWITPIMWDAEHMLSPKLLKIFKLNPVYYIVDGFRDSLLAGVGFWEKPMWTVYFWLFVIIVFSIGVSVFKRLRVHFADVL
ncbi:ABC transporter permease [Eubacterium sp. MSJ-33]|uniref:ABC transporter permease n=1 Tax=Eubacterium sp. MSJ-33 TaxID=2841528 RepID=UPI001C7587A4|nr:ABC transporter permease [Eubacterium sp. MSJ-33]QWT52135.1 ABC transporter permease [Eubacterium sp. MSJ-33]